MVADVPHNSNREPIEHYYYLWCLSSFLCGVQCRKHDSYKETGTSICTGSVSEMPVSAREAWRACIASEYSKETRANEPRKIGARSDADLKLLPFFAWRSAGSERDTFNTVQDRRRPGQRRNTG